MTAAVGTALPPGLVVAAPASGCGKTLVTLGVLRHFRDTGVRIASAKIGPDYIDPAFHAAASGRTCVNLDAWAMRRETQIQALVDAATGADLLIAEGVMGLFDGANLDDGSTADVAALFGWPVILVVDASAQGASAAAVVRGFDQHRPDTRVAGVIFNRVGSDRHAGLIRDAMARDLDHVPVLGCLPRRPGLVLPERHLGLVQAREHGNLEGFISAAAEVVAAHLDTAKLRALAGTTRVEATKTNPIQPLGQRIAVAKDDAFAFSYPHILDNWRQAGAELTLFSPLADEPPGPDADAVYLPGGYPELHAEKIAGNTSFLEGLRNAANRGALVFGECGGYMVLGTGLIDADHKRHAMAGLLPLETSFADPKLHLGYRRASLTATTPLGPAGTVFRAHEFHYASIVSEDEDHHLFESENAQGTPLSPMGTRQASVMGSFLHLIDRET